MTRTIVLPSTGRAALTPLDAAEVRVTGGFWAERLRTNRERTIPHGLEQLEASGALGNFRNAAKASGRYVGGIDDAGLTFPFLDSDVYKWLEAVGWELGRGADEALRAAADEVVELVASAQREDGYLNTFVQLSGHAEYSDLQWGHELYCVGHLTQAAVAWQRSLGDDRLVRVAAGAIAHIDSALGADGREGVGGHPEIEMALVELFRTTGQQRYLDLASLLVERRGRGLMGPGRLGDRYWQDHAPVREAPTMAGHAVRQLYLDCGAVDVAVETGDDELLGAVLARWTDMWATRTYLTGALGSRHRDEAFGDAMELPSDRAYAETCAAIASVMLSWRLLLATGESRFADATERTLYNAVLPGISADGTHFFYTNPLQIRSTTGSVVSAAGGRRSWYPCACCPPNLMRTLSTFEQLIATQDDAGVQLHQYASASVATPRAGGNLRLRVDTVMPFDGPVEIVVQESVEAPWSLRCRVPAWARDVSATVNGEGAQAPGAGWIELQRTWQAGDRIRIDIPMPVRFTVPDARIDAVRGTVAIERGPLVYTFEQVDLPAGVSLEDIDVRTDVEPTTRPIPALSDMEGLVAVEAQASVRPHAEGAAPGWPYGDLAEQSAALAPESITVRAMPYLAWANREPGPMRVWLPAAGPS